MQTQILKSFDLTKPYINKVRHFADLNKKSFGFLRSSVYEELALNGRLWVLINTETQELNGYIMFGENYPVLRVFQLFVEPSSRQKGYAHTLIKELINYGEYNYFSTIRAKVATELNANNFWERSGFLIIDQMLGGTAKSKQRRLINYRSYTLDTPDLFKTNTNTNISLSIPEKPQFSIPVFTIDLNVLYDISKKRNNSEQAKQVFQYGLIGAFRLCVTPEFEKELERTQFNRNNDPIYEIAKAFPKLNVRNEDELEPLRENLRQLIFPDRPSNNKTAKNDQSDLTHLAYCSLERVGFITSDKAILLQTLVLKEHFGITVISPSEIDFGDTSYESISIDSDNEILDFNNLSPINLEQLKTYKK